MGVWIETAVLPSYPRMSGVTPFVGVWIETVEASFSTPALRVTPFVGVWIETQWVPTLLRVRTSHPSWVCGLKPSFCTYQYADTLSHPSWVCGLKLL